MKLIVYPNSLLSRAIFVALVLFSFVSCVAAESYSKFGIIRANIAQYISDHRWLVCYEPKRSPEKSEVVGFDAGGNIFRIRGELRPGAANLLSLESYEEPSVAFSTNEGYLYIWNTSDGDPFEYYMKVEEYEKLIEKFEFFPLFESSKDAPIKFELLKESPDFYDGLLGFPRPKSSFHLESPTARRLKVGMFLEAQPNNKFSVRSVIKNSAAAAAGIKAGDTIMSLAVNGINVEMEKGFPIPDDKSIRILTLKIKRKSVENETDISDINVFLPSPLESFVMMMRL